MARIRTIKPDFPHSESMGNVSRDARLAFVMLWTVADDSGRLRGNSRMLASLLFPYDNDAPALIDGWLYELAKEKCITRYEVDGSHYIQIENWLIHQKIDKPSASKIPSVREHSRDIREDSRGFVGGKEGKGEDKEGKGEENLDTTICVTRIDQKSDESVKLIAVFDECLVEVFGKSLARPYPHPTDHATAKEFMSIMPNADFFKEHVRWRMHTMAKRKVLPPTSLAFFRNSLVDAVAKSREHSPQSSPTTASQKRSHRLDQQDYSQGTEGFKVYGIAQSQPA